MTRDEKSTSIIAWTSLLLSLAVNILTAPLSYYIGAFETNPPTDTASAFIIRFLFIQGLPLVWLIFSIYFFAKWMKKTTVM